MRKRMKVVCLGDSITWGFPFGPHYSWVSMLEQATGAEFVNRGINGNTTTDMLSRFERDVIAYSPTHVMIMGGVNDMLWGDSFDRITWNINAMIEKAEKAGIQVFLGIPTAVESVYLEKLIARLRKWLFEVGSQKDITIIDFSKAFLGPDGELQRQYLLADGAHPSETGYREMFKQIDLTLFKKYIDEPD